MKTKALLAGLMLGGLMSDKASAAVLFSNLNASDSSTGSATILGGADAFGDSTLAGDFTVAGDNYFLTSIEVVVANFSAAPNTVSASIRANNGGVPGTILESFSFTGDLGESNSPTTLLFNSVLTPLLADGETYWIAVTSGNPDKTILWLNNSVGDDRDAQLDFDSDNTWEATEFADPAFRVIAEVPEPTALAMLSFTPMLLGRRRSIRL